MSSSSSSNAIDSDYAQYELAIPWSKVESFHQLTLLRNYTSTITL